ncbi:immunoglobulin-like domain-containing protein [Pseudomonas sp. 147P]|uniref:immunoglobulin-like domain-containing protein n=1 Tax=Pseudomonas ulcerans TaxID=3115852 RepID=UPI002E7C2AB3|nr:immunoglobulin-like domain-containing protein [Pseudomonas sp. 147P]MEE1926575.1 immunoglobulin-like domain-containing protein [Pseudomonas sp. 147P]
MRRREGNRTFAQAFTDGDGLAVAQRDLHLGAYTARLTNPAGTEMKISLSNGETITIGKGLSEGSITFPAPQNTVYVDGGNVSVTITGTTGGDFEHLEVSPV